ncbi:hypothetical protein [Pantoea anthophila]|uniref:hypothetical protein n=1 Tax=Pantoea anthophila TaxID=470931 RepID=UPI00289F4E41|nr:hypothetical protein [Pantoea anthophila]
MESFGITYENGNIEISGIPDANRLFKLPKSISKDLTDLNLHMTDLNISLESLDYIQNNPQLDRNNVCESLWRSSIIHFIKCFTDQVRGGGKGSRTKLNENEIFSNFEPAALEAFKYFKSLRNKHIVHDENAYLQSLPGVVLNDGTKDYKVEKVICASFLAVTLEQANFSNLYNLVSTTLKYTIKLFDEECNRLTTLLEQHPDEYFYKMEKLEFEIPLLEDVEKTRK